ncbi:MAG: hypothetical protein RLZZ299_621 [Pseudomonadota bacterium]|jgi:YHS domain-containing protein
MTLALLPLLLACAGAPSVSAPASTPPAAALPAGLTAFVNDDGKLACPVMGDVVDGPDKAAGHTDHQGKRYYFCCDSCAQLFEEQPERYADGRYLQSIGKMRAGTADTPACEDPPAATPSAG